MQLALINLKEFRIVFYLNLIYKTIALARKYKSLYSIIIPKARLSFLSGLALVQLPREEGRRARHGGKSWESMKATDDDDFRKAPLLHTAAFQNTVGRFWLFALLNLNFWIQQGASYFFKDLSWTSEYDTILLKVIFQFQIDSRKSKSALVETVKLSLHNI